MTALAVTPGYLRSEAMLDYFGVTEANWQDAAKKDPHFIASETLLRGPGGGGGGGSGRDGEIRRRLQLVGTGRSTATDIDGRRPDWGKYFEEQGR